MFYEKKLFLSYMLNFIDMKTFLTLFLLSVSMLAFSQPSTSLNLKLTNDLFYSRTPAAGKGVRLNLKNKLEPVWVVTSDNTNSRRLSAGQSVLNEKGKSIFLVVLSQLYKYAVDGNVRQFYFGEKGAENNLDQSVVRVLYNNDAPSPGKTLNRQPVLIGSSESEFFTVPAGGTPGGDITGKLFLKVEASSDKTATIEIDRESQRGNVLVAVFSEKTGNLLATLNPKDPNNQAKTISFTVNETVLIIPVVRPKVSSATGVDTIRFEVGDPQQVATVEATEE
jgi:hypothetical protein